MYLCRGNLYHYSFHLGFACAPYFRSIQIPYIYSRNLEARVMNRSTVRNFQVTIAAIFVFTVLLLSCEKVVHISLASTPPQVVVDGAIETNIPPYVILTSTIGFFSNIDLSTLQNSFLHGAEISVSCGAKSVNLVEYSFDTGNNNKFYIYTVDTTNLSNIMLGQVDSFYTLTIKYGGQTYTSVTKIPNPKGIDTMWFATPTYQDSKTPKGALQLFVNYTDPDTPGNCVRYFTQLNGGPYYPSQIFSDEVVNGKTVKDIGLFAGYAQTIDANGDSLSYFYAGDTVTLKWCEIDQGVYNFWNTAGYAASAIGNPFASPINLQSNMTNGALGVWAGYGSTFKTAVVP